MSGNRVRRLSIVVSPQIHEQVRQAADELGVSMSAWCAMRLAEAARSQERVSRVLEGFGRDLASLMREVDGDD